MAGLPLKQFTITPDLPRSPQIIDERGFLKADWKLFFEQLIQALQNTFTPEGIAFPQQTAANIAQLTSVNSLGNILYDTTNNVFKGNILTAPNTYTWKTFDMS